MDQGHCGLPVSRSRRARRRRSWKWGPLIEEAIHPNSPPARSSSDTIGDAPCVFLKGLYRPSALSPGGCSNGLRQAALAKIDLEKALPWIDGRTGRTLCAVAGRSPWLVLRTKVAVVTGGPGTGKTSSLDAILRILVAKGCPGRLALPPVALPSA